MLPVRAKLQRRSIMPWYAANSPLKSGMQFSGGAIQTSTVSAPSQMLFKGGILTQVHTKEVTVWQAILFTAGWAKLTCCSKKKN